MTSFLLPETIVAHDHDVPLDAVVPPIAQTSLFTFRDYDEMLATYRGELARPVYSRGLNPTVRAFEEKLAQLEGAEDACAFGSGMAAISATVLTFAGPGDRIVALESIYPDAYRFFETLCARFGIQVDYVDGSDPDAVEAALPGARLLYLESPTSWVIEAHDVGALAALARRHGVLSVIDNSWATPIFQQPLGLGVDIVLHSASKYLGGHSDVVAGVIAGPKALVTRVRNEALPYLGGKCSPMDGWLLLRGLRTLPLRMKAHQEAAALIADRLAAHPQVTSVAHPSRLATLPPGLTGWSGLMSFAVSERIHIPRFCNALRLFRLGVSWGGHESLVVPAQVVLSQAAPPNAALAFNMDPRSVRIHVGLEGAEPLWADLSAALDAAAAPSQDTARS
ncbi:PLP-dependent transferase [Pseudooceanicola sp. CBS1P-1]|uniref:Aminotransferase class I/II-fold pyridoxal phosphate-dependent enzyme n=1 Tax=Pseudooceanicola albus TaxID=2692189 RepID=A0A6L7G3R7_9RHOB|nr:MULTISPECIES: PLP-dependent transferase [Pseudooceanicola]MBT9385189.1 PLP-dependent transferase [Pseudooceanicola endophyticus]MXN18519.1 aminotransferase class I/II-fold pyridoxal phosphate-dependent enzyme [Pseudooceanicola albus]